MPRLTSSRRWVSALSNCPYRTIGSAMNTPISRTSLSVSECASRRTSRRRLRHGRFAPPSVAEGQEVFDFGEVRINGAELVANSLDGRADIGSVSILYVRSEEPTSELQSLMR